jgi:protease-4
VISVLELQDPSASLEYYIACASDEVYAMPGISLPLVGLAAEYLYLGGLWEKVGVEFQVARVGKYKSAVEVYAGRGMSEASREMANSLLDSIESQFVGGIAASRDLSVDEVRAAIDTGPVLASQLKSLGLIDGIKHRDELEVIRDGKVVSGVRYQNVDPASVGFEPVAHFALIYGTGTVMGGRGSTSPTGAPLFAAGPFAQALEDAANDPEISAIILRIDSPGGSAAASEEIWHAINKLTSRADSKPVIASFSDVAASGGYYVAAAADAIVASPGAITGSIGVFSLRPSIGGLLDKLGINVESLTRGAHADLLLSSQPLSAGAKERLQQTVVEIYDLFLARVAQGRSLATAEVDAVGQGRVWTAAQAYERGLVDELGGLHTAVKRAKRASGLDEDAEVALIPYPQPRSLVEQLSELMDVRMRVLARSAVPLPGVLETLRDRLMELPVGTPLLIPPIIADIH